MAEASNVGFKVEWKKTSVLERGAGVERVFWYSEEQVLSMSSMGTILAAVSPEARGKVENALRQNKVESSFVGFFTKDRWGILVKNDEEMLFPRGADDPYVRIFSGKL